MAGIDSEVERVEEVVETGLGVEGNGVVVVVMATNEAGRVLSVGRIGTVVGSTILRRGTEVGKVPSISNSSDIGEQEGVTSSYGGSVCYSGGCIVCVCVCACVCLRVVVTECRLPRGRRGWWSGLAGAVSLQCVVVVVSKEEKKTRRSVQRSLRVEQKLHKRKKKKRKKEKKKRKEKGGWISGKVRRSIGRTKRTAPGDGGRSRGRGRSVVGGVKPR